MCAVLKAIRDIADMIEDRVQAATDCPPDDLLDIDPASEVLHRCLSSDSPQVTINDPTEGAGHDRV